MTIKRPIHAAPFTVAAILIMTMAASASASSIVYDTTDGGSIFVGSGLTLNSTGGAAATLAYHPIGDTTVGVPTNINLGSFTLSCPSCGTEASGLGTSFGAFTFDLIISDDTPTNDTAVGEFVGTSSGGTVWSDQSSVSISWLPVSLGPGTTNAISGNFGTSVFTISTPSLIVSPNSGSNPGTTTVQGALASTAAPEPATMAMVGGLFIGLAALARKRRA